MPGQETATLAEGPTSGAHALADVQVVQPRPRPMPAPDQVIVAIPEGGLLDEDWPLSGARGLEFHRRQRDRYARLVEMHAIGMDDALVGYDVEPASVLRGPRRVGKTVLLRQLIESLIAEAVNPQCTSPSTSCRRCETSRSPCWPSRAGTRGKCSPRPSILGGERQAREGTAWCSGDPQRRAENERAGHVRRLRHGRTKHFPTRPTRDAPQTSRRRGDLRPSRSAARCTSRLRTRGLLRSPRRRCPCLR
jgi:hypothetical protein